MNRLIGRRNRPIPVHKRKMRHSSNHAMGQSGLSQGFDHRLIIDQPVSESRPSCAVLQAFGVKCRPNSPACWFWCCAFACNFFKFKVPNWMVTATRWPWLYLKISSPVSQMRLHSPIRWRYTIWLVKNKGDQRLDFTIVRVGRLV